MKALRFVLVGAGGRVCLSLVDSVSLFWGPCELRVKLVSLLLNIVKSLRPFHVYTHSSLAPKEKPGQ